MTDKLIQIKKQIEDAENQLTTLQSQMVDLKNRLSEKRAEQAASILENKPTRDLENEVVSLQTQLSGMHQAIKKQEQILRGFQADKAQELQKIGREQAEKAKNESAQLMSEIYSLVARCIPRLVDLKIKNTEYLKARKAANPAERMIGIGEKTRTSAFINYLEVELPKLLSGFPNEVLANEDLPKLEEIRRALKK